MVGAAVIGLPEQVDKYVACVALLLLGSARHEFCLKTALRPVF